MAKISSSNEVPVRQALNTNAQRPAAVSGDRARALRDVSMINRRGLHAAPHRAAAIQKAKTAMASATSSGSLDCRAE